MMGSTHPSDMVFGAFIVLLTLNILSFVAKIYIFIRQCVLHKEFYDKYRLVNPAAEETVLFQSKVILPLILHENIYQFINYFYVVRYRPLHLSMSVLNFYNLQISFLFTFITLSFAIVDRISVVRQERHIQLQTQAIIRWRLTILYIAQQAIAPFKRIVQKTTAVEDEIEKLHEALSELKQEHLTIQRKKQNQNMLIPLVLFVIVYMVYKTVYAFQLVLVMFLAQEEWGKLPSEFFNKPDSVWEQILYGNTSIKIINNTYEFYGNEFFGKFKEMYKPRTSNCIITELVGGDCKYSKNSTDRCGEPDPFGRENDTNKCLNHMEIAFIAVAGILSLSFLILVYRWKRTAEKLGFEEEVVKLRQSVTSMNTSIRDFFNMLMKWMSQKCTSMRNTANHSSSASSIFTNNLDHDIEEGLDVVFATVTTAEIVLEPVPVVERPTEPVPETIQATELVLEPVPPVEQVAEVVYETVQQMW